MKFLKQEGNLATGRKTQQQERISWEQETNYIVAGMKFLEQGGYSCYRKEHIVFFPAGAGALLGIMKEIPA